MKIYTNIFEEMTSLERLFDSWGKFRRGKTKRKDVQIFERNLEANVFHLHRELQAQTYQHGDYHEFFVHDPKIRHIRKACVRDRLIHQSVYTSLVRIYEPKFIFHSFSCREDKGTHKALDFFRGMTLKVSKNNTKPCFALKCDIRKFFDSVDHETLLNLLERVVIDEKSHWLFKEVISSCILQFSDQRKRGLPIGNLTSQIFTNIYLNELDQFVKHQLRQKYYIRYADDFFILDQKEDFLASLIPQIRYFLDTHLKLELHPKKVSINKLSQGIDFLGYITFEHYRIIRTKTKRRMLKKMKVRFTEYFSGTIINETMRQTLNSYLGVLSHGDNFTLTQEIKVTYWFSED